MSKQYWMEAFRPLTSECKKWVFRTAAETGVSVRIINEAGFLRRQLAFEISGPNAGLVAFNMLWADLMKRMEAE